MSEQLVLYKGELIPVNELQRKLDEEDIKICPVCKNKFKAGYEEQIYCSRKCSKTAQVRGLLAHNKLLQGKTLEEVYGFQKAFEIKKKEHLSHKGEIWTKERREHQSKSLKGRRITWGNKISKALKGYKHTDTSRQHMSLGQIGNTNHKGYKHSLETIKLISQKKKEFYKTEEGQRIKEIIRETVRKTLRDLAANRNLDTDIERKVIECLESLGLVREKDFLIKPYIETTKTYRFPDILLPKYRLVIECDGEYWHDETYDKERDKELAELGFKILHLKETVILEYPNLKEYLQKKIFQDEWRVPVLYVDMKKKRGDEYVGS